MLTFFRFSAEITHQTSKSHPRDRYPSVSLLDYQIIYQQLEALPKSDENNSIGDSFNNAFFAVVILPAVLSHCAGSRIPYLHGIHPDIEHIAHNEADFGGPIRPSLLRYLTGNFVSLRVPRHEARRILFPARANPFQNLTVHNKTS